MLKKFTRHFWKLIALALACVAANCSGDDGAMRKKPKAQPAAESWAIHIYVGEPSAWKKVDLGPVKLASGPTTFAAVPGAVAGAENPGSKTQGVIETPDGAAEFGDDLSGQNAWALVYGAAAECGMIGTSSGEHPELNPFTKTQLPHVPPWDDAYSIFNPNGPDNSRRDA